MKLTIREIAKAMIKDPTPKTTGDLQLFITEGDEDKYPNEAHGFTHSCAIGGAAYVLGVNAERLMGVLSKVDRDGVPYSDSDHEEYDDNNSIARVIWMWNDATEAEKADIGKLILENADEDTLNTVVTVGKETRKSYKTFIATE